MDINTILHEHQIFMKLRYSRNMRIHTTQYLAVFRIRIHRIHMFFGLPAPDPLVRGMNPDQAIDPSTIKQK